jgi:hypothetical protein
MSTNNRVTVLLLWISVIVWSIWFGGTIYQMLVIVPIWGDSLPDSLHAFFKGTSYNHNILHFFGPGWMPVRFLPLYGILFFGWRLTALHRHGDLHDLCIGVHSDLRISDQRSPLYSGGWRSQPRGASCHAAALDYRGPIAFRRSVRRVSGIAASI